MKYTNSQLQNYFDALSNIASKTTGKLGYIVAKNANTISKELEEYVDIRNQKIAEFGEQDENGVPSITLGTEAFNKFTESMKEYDEVEQDISFIKIKPEDLYSSDLNAVEINQIMFMVDEEDDL